MENNYENYITMLVSEVQSQDESSQFWFGKVSGDREITIIESRENRAFLFPIPVHLGCCACSACYSVCLANINYFKSDSRAASFTSHWLTSDSSAISRTFCSFWDWKRTSFRQNIPLVGRFQKNNSFPDVARSGEGIYDHFAQIPLWIISNVVSHFWILN